MQMRVPVAAPVHHCALLLHRFLIHQVKYQHQPISCASSIIASIESLCVQEKPGTASGSDSGAVPEERGGQSQGEDGKKVILDWKGDPMTINPGDKLPFF